MDRQRQNSTSKQSGLSLEEKVDKFIQSRSQPSGQHHKFSSSDERNRAPAGRDHRSQDQDSIHERRRDDTDRKGRKDRKADGQEDPDDDFESDQFAPPHPYPRHNTSLSPQMQKKRQQHQQPQQQQRQDYQHKSSRAINEQTHQQAQFSPVSKGKKSMQSPTVSTPPRTKRGIPIATPSSPITQLDRPRPTSTSPYVPRKIIISPSPTSKPSTPKRPSTDLKLGRLSPLLDSDSDLEEDIFSGTPQGNQKRPKETRPIGLTRSTSVLSSSSSSKDFEETRPSRRHNKESQQQERSHHKSPHRKAAKAVGSKKSQISVRDASDSEDGDRSDFQRTSVSARPERRVLNVSDKSTKKSHNKAAVPADVKPVPISWQIAGERFPDIFGPSRSLVGGRARQHGDTDATKHKDSNYGSRSSGPSNKSKQDDSNEKSTKRSLNEKNMAESALDLQRKKSLGSTTPTTTPANFKARLSQSMPKEKTIMSSRNNSMPSPDDHAALELHALGDGYNDGNEDEDEDDDKPRRKRRNRRSRSPSSDSDSDRPARSSVDPMTPKRDKGFQTTKSSREAASHKSPGSTVKHTGPKFSLPSPSKKKIRMTIPSNVVFLSDDEIPAQALNDDEQSRNICPYCGDVLPKTPRMATALESVLAKLARDQEQREQLQQQYLLQRQERQQQLLLLQKQQQQQKQLQLQQQQQQQIPVIDLEADGDSVGRSPASSVISGSERRRPQPRPRPLKRKNAPSKPIGNENDTLVVLDDDDDDDDDQEKEDDDEEEEKDEEEDDLYDNMDDPTNPLSLYPPKISLMEKFEFCRIHDAEALVVPMGIREEYPMHIDFSKLDERIAGLEPELRGIIERSVRSPYLDRALKNYERMGTLGARRPHVVLANVDHTLPGYYGSKGSAEMFRILAAMFIESQILTHERAHPQKPVEYIQQVLIPETAMRLIQQDRIVLHQRDVTLEEAQEVMTRSVEFGGYVHDLEQSHVF